MLALRAPGDGRRRCTLGVAEYRTPAQPGEPATRHRQGEFLAWAATAPATPRLFRRRDLLRVLDLDRSGGAPEATATGFYRRSEAGYYDLDDNGVVSDDERDEDADGLTNYDESHGRMLPSYWAERYPGEVPYYIAYKGTDLVDADSDGDGVRDGADDQDHDDLHNLAELSRNAASGHTDPGTPSARSAVDDGQAARPAEPVPAQGPREPVQPVPALHRLADLQQAPPLSGAWAPFAEDEKIYYVFN